MIEYITVADVDNYATNVNTWTALDTVTKEKHVYEANIYLTNENLLAMEADAIPEPVNRAGCELALMSHSEGLYKDDAEAVTSESVKLGSLSLSTSYDTSAKAQHTAQLNNINAYLKPYKIKSGNAYRLIKGE